MLLQHKLFILSIIAACNAQEYLTCLRTDNTRNPFTNVQRGFRIGKQGPKGDKGDPGVANDSQIISLRDELSSLRHQLEAIQANINSERNMRADLLRGYSNLDGGWIAPFNGYQYKVTLTPQLWHNSRRTCQSWGGDLIVHGIRDRAVRNAILRGLSNSTARQYWIGLSDRETEGTFLWLNGEQASTTDDNFWYSTQPNGGDCCNAVFRWVDVRVFDDPCTGFELRAVCEKLI